MRACTFSPDSRVAPGSLKSELRRPGPTLHSCPSAHFHLTDAIYTRGESIIQNSVYNNYDNPEMPKNFRHAHIKII